MCRICVLHHSLHGCDHPNNCQMDLIYQLILETESRQWSDGRGLTVYNDFNTSILGLVLAKATKIYRK